MPDLKPPALKACPFCNGPAIKPRGCIQRVNIWWIQCDACGMEGPVTHSEESSIAAWNRRPPEASSEAVRAACVDVAKSEQEYAQSMLDEEYDVETRIPERMDAAWHVATRILERIEALDLSQFPACRPPEGDAAKQLKALLEAYDSGNLEMNSPEIDGDGHTIPPHAWHEEWLSLARSAVARVAPEGDAEDSKHINWLGSLTRGDTLICPPGNHDGESENWLVSLNADRLADNSAQGSTLREALAAARAVRADPEQEKT